MDPEDATRPLPKELLAMRQNLQPRLLRQLTQQLLSSEDAFDAFCRDAFPNVKRQFGAAMGHLAKETRLLESVEQTELFDALYSYDSKRMLKACRRIQATVEQGKQNDPTDADEPRVQAPSAGGAFWTKETIFLLVVFVSLILILYQCTMYVVFAPTADSVTAKPQRAPVAPVVTAASATLPPDVPVLGRESPADAAAADSTRGVDAPKAAAPPSTAPVPPPPPATPAARPSPRSQAPRSNSGPARLTR